MDLNEIPKSASSITAEWLPTALALEDSQRPCSKKKLDCHGQLRFIWS